MAAVLQNPKVRRAVRTFDLLERTSALITNLRPFRSRYMFAYCSRNIPPAWMLHVQAGNENKWIGPAAHHCGWTHLQAIADWWTKGNIADPVATALIAKTLGRWDCDMSAIPALNMIHVDVDGVKEGEKPNLTVVLCGAELWTP